MSVSLGAGHSSVASPPDLEGGSESKPPVTEDAGDPNLFYSRDLKNRATWVPHDVAGSCFSDPRKFNPEQFQFIVHTIGPTGPYQEICKNPNASFAERLLSVSVINQDKLKTFIFDCGFILKVPAANIYATRSEDMYLRNKAAEKRDTLVAELTRVNALYGISSPADMMKRSLPTKINEVAVLGNTLDGGRVKVDGIFYKVLKKRKSGKLSTPGSDKRILPLLIQYARANNLPVVEIPITYERDKKAEKEEKKDDE